jgi:hypothetical protein
VHSMTFAQRQTRLTKHFSEHITVVKRSISVYAFFQISIFITHILSFWTSCNITCKNVLSSHNQKSKTFSTPSDGNLTTKATSLATFYCWNLLYEPDDGHRMNVKLSHPSFGCARYVCICWKCMCLSVGNVCVYLLGVYVCISWECMCLSVGNVCVYLLGV